MIHEIVNNPEKYAGNENENIKKNGDRVWIVWTNQPIFDQEPPFERNPLYRNRLY